MQKTKRIIHHVNRTMEQSIFTKEEIWKPILACLAFIIAQTIFGLVAKVLSNSADGLSPAALGLATSLGGITTVYFSAKVLQMYDTKETIKVHGTPGTSSWVYAIAMGVLGFTAGTLAINILSEQIPLEDNMQEEFLSMAHDWVGILSICIIAPIVEEFIFREGMIGYWLRKGKSPLYAIVVSSLIFGAIHMNPAQMPFAFLSGILLGIIYWKTRNIIFCSILHILNNSVAILTMPLPDEAPDALSNSIDCVGPIWLFFAAFTLICILSMYGFCRTFQTRALNI